MTVYLDTSILYRLLNLQGSHRYESMKSLILFCQQAKMDVRVLQCSMEELKRRIRFDARVIVDHPTPIAFSAIGYKCRSEENYISTFWREQSKTGISVQDFNFRYFNILPHLDEFGISVDERDYINELNLQTKYTDMRAKVREYGIFYDGKKSENAIDHDAECLTIVEQLQRKNSSSAIEARAMFLSTDWSLVRLQRYDHEYREKTDLVALPSQLLQIFCLSTPTCDYFDAFLGLFASAHTSFGTGQLNNIQIQEIMGRVAAYSDRPLFAEKVLANQVIQSKFSEQETEDEKNAVIDEAIISEIEHMEIALEAQSELLSKKILK